MSETPEAAATDEAVGEPIVLDVPTADGNDVGGVLPVEAEEAPAEPEAEDATDADPPEEAEEPSFLAEGGDVMPERDLEDPADAETAQADPPPVPVPDASSHAFVPGVDDPQPEGAYVPDPE
jgi:hypothetical protein